MELTSAWCVYQVCGGKCLCLRAHTAGVFGLGWALELLKRAAGTAPLAMADCSSPWLTEWLVDRSYSACVTCEGWQE